MKFRLGNLSHVLAVSSFVAKSVDSWVMPQLNVPSTRNLKVSNQQRSPSRMIMSSSSTENDDGELNSHVNGEGSDIIDGDSVNGSSEIPQNVTSSISDPPTALKDMDEDAIAEAADKRYRVLKAQQEIDRLLNSPLDPPFDLEGEMKKVVSMSPPLIAEGSEEYLLAEQVSEMEHQLYEAVKREDFELAASTSNEISQQHIDDCGLVLQMNSKFYKAFSDKNIVDMKNIWLPDRSCVCIHPSHKPLLGIKSIMDSYDKMFLSSDGSFQRNWMEPQEIRVSVKATTAVITCEQHVYARRFVRGQKRQTELVNKLMATNLFRKVGGKWYMTYHHSSWHADSEPAKMALKQGGGGMKQDIRSDSFIDRTKVRDNQDDEPTGIDNITGVKNFGPLLGDSDTSNSGEDPNKPKKIIMGGSLSDILNGGLLGDILGGDDAMPPSSNDISNLGGENGINIIKIKRKNPPGDFNDARNGDNEDDDDDDDIYNVDSQIDNDKDEEFLNRKKGKKPKKLSTQQKCIAALRKLAGQGRISQKQKRTLLTDIISRSAGGEISMVEVAYDLLCSEYDEMTEEECEVADEEFADQCIVFAESISEEQFPSSRF